MKRPKTLWIGFSSETKSYRVYEHDPHLAYAKPYHLHPGDEVARALNIIRGDVWYYNLNTTDKDVAEDLRNNGIPIRWNEKKGRFV